MRSNGPESTPQSNASEIATNLMAGLTVSFVAISLGAAFGLLSGRGAFAGILSAGVIALITSLFGGTRVQCSGPTAPMTAVTIGVITTAAASGKLAAHAGVSIDHFVNLVCIVTGVMLLIAALLRLGRFISFVPKVVISGFMNGIAVLIWLDQIKKVFGIGGKEPIGGPVAMNLALALVTLAMVFLLPRVLRPLRMRALPATLVAIILMSAVANVMGLPIQFTHLDASIDSLDGLVAMVSEQVPRDWSLSLILLAAPFALQLTLLCYLDTLLTSLVVDKMATEKFGRKEQTSQNRELAAQGLANSVVGLFGGIPGAQATIRSVLILNEGATLRLAGICVGLFVIVEMLLFQQYISLIPQAVFTGVLIKVGYDVFDWEPVIVYLKNLRSGRALPSPSQAYGLSVVRHAEIAMIAGTTLVTIVLDLNVAVIGFSLLFYLLGRVMPMTDIDPDESPSEFAAPDSPQVDRGGVVLPSPG
jgi:SulP family sulfate permease